MRQIAEGKLDTHIATQGRDEISEMAVALVSFAETQAELIQAGKLGLGQPGVEKYVPTVGRY